MKHSEGFSNSSTTPRAASGKSRSRKPRTRAGNGVRLIDVREDHEWNAGRAAVQPIAKGIIGRDIDSRA